MTDLDLLTRVRGVGEQAGVLLAVLLDVDGDLVDDGVPDGVGTQAKRDVTGERAMC